VLIHGFTQNARCWGGFADGLADGSAGSRQVIAVDLPGHGDSSDVRANLWETAELVAETCGPADYLGYSLGGRVLLHVALARPEVVKRAVFIGATAGIEDGGARVERVETDEALARRLDEAVGDPAALEAFLRRWLAGPLFSGLSDVAAHLDERLRNDPSGLASSLRLCGTGKQDDHWGRVANIASPALVVAGENDKRFTAIGQRLAFCIGSNASFAAVPGSGHACQLEEPTKTAEIVRDFLKEGSR
jgi:2-succinyl-6-hydroxy-2,4-cyclohexadiene-1-carboxylate synthase